MKFSWIVLSILVLGCGTTSKKLQERPPLAMDAPVEVFWTEPNVKYEKICEIEAKGNNSLGPMYTKKEDFETMFKEEARKCGANSAIFQSMSGYTNGTMNATAIGVQVTGQAAGLSGSDQIKAFSLAIQTHDVNKVRELLAKVPKNQAERAPSDDEMVNIGLYIATLDGLSCDAKVVDLLEKDYQAKVPKFRAIDMPGLSKPDSKSPLCRDVMARSLPLMKDPTDAVLNVNNHYVDALSIASDRDKKAKAFNKLLVEAARLIKAGCARASTDSLCVLKAGFVDFSTKTKNGSAALKKNSRDVLKILGGK